MIAQVDKNYFRINPIASGRRLITRLCFEGRPITTKARWLNYFVFAFFETAKRLPQLTKVEKPIFIVGTGRSGTTILGSILSIHPQVGYLNEPKALWHVVDQEEDVIGHYSLGPARYRLNAADATAGVSRTAHRLFGAYLAFTFSRRIVDKNPENVFRIPFIKTIFPDAIFLFLVRNGWNTCYSIARWSNGQGIEQDGQTHDWWGVNNRKWHLMLSQLVAQEPDISKRVDVISGFTHHTDKAAVEWVITMREGLRQLSSDPSVHLVRYEDLTADSAATLSKILDLCQLPGDRRVFEYAARVLTPSPNHPPFQLDSSILPIFEKTLEEMGY